MKTIVERIFCQPGQTEKIIDPLDSNRMITVRRWKSTSRLSVSTGGIMSDSVSGYVDANIDLSKGDAWVGYDAIVYGNVIMENGVCIEGKSIVHGPEFISQIKTDEQSCLLLRDNVHIYNNAIVGSATNSYFGHELLADGSRPKIRLIAENVEIGGNAVVDLPIEISRGVRIFHNASIAANSTLRGFIRIYDDATLAENVVFRGNIFAHKNSRISKDVIILGDMDIADNTVIDAGSRIRDGVMMEKFPILVPPVPTKKPERVFVAAEPELNQTKTRELDFLSLSLEPRLGSNPTKTTSTPVALQRKVNIDPETRIKWIERFTAVKHNIDDYSSDIVKIIKYPLMMDLTNEYSAEMIFSLKDAEIASTEGDELFMKAVINLERKFMIAESYAKKMANSTLTVDQKKKATKATDLFAIACNESSSEQEKRSAFKQGFAQLSGVIAVPDDAVSALKSKIGLAELEA